MQTMTGPSSHLLVKYLVLHPLGYSRATILENKVQPPSLRILGRDLDVLRRRGMLDHIER